VNISQSGQLAMRKILEAYLQRVEWDEVGVVARLYPFTRKRMSDEPKAIVIDPRISFGRPVSAGGGIPAAVMRSRTVASTEYAAREKRPEVGFATPLLETRVL